MVRPGRTTEWLHESPLFVEITPSELVLYDRSDSRGQARTRCHAWNWCQVTVIQGIHKPGGSLIYVPANTRVWTGMVNGNAYVSAIRIPNEPVTIVVHTTETKAKWMLLNKPAIREYPKLRYYEIDANQIYKKDERKAVDERKKKREVERELKLIEDAKKKEEIRIRTLKRAEAAQEKAEADRIKKENQHVRMVNSELMSSIIQQSKT